MNDAYNKNILVEFNGRIAQKKRIEKYVKQVIRHFCPRMRRIVTINISVSTRLDGDVYGYCYGGKKDIDIELARGSGDEEFTLDYMMLNLAHELIHAKQFLTGQLTPYYFRWKNKDYSFTPYSKVPWEREAYKKEDYIYEHFWKNA